MKAQSLITPFINDQLGINDLQEFITHVQKCKECREELEVYYALLTAMNQLNDDINFYDDYSYELAAKLEKAQEHIIHVKFTYYRKKSVLIFIILAIAIVASVGYVERENNEDDIVTESDFRIRRMYHEDNYQRIMDELKVYIEINNIVIEQDTTEEGNISPLEEGVDIEEGILGEDGSLAGEDVQKGQDERELYDDLDSYDNPDGLQGLDDRTDKLDDEEKDGVIYIEE